MLKLTHTKFRPFFTAAQIPSDVATSKTSGHRKLTLRTPAAPTFVDIDVDNGAEQSACIAYAPEIFAHLREAEIRHRPCTTYMESRQTDINAAMRSILVDWLVEVAQEYRLTSDTLFLSVAIIDRYLSVKDVKRNRLQLLGVSAMLIASKYEEIYAPQVDEFCFITDNTYSREAVLEMERDLLNELGFELTQPTIKTFLRRYIKAASGEVQLDITFEFLCSYLAELALLDYGLLGHLPSKVAAGCVMLALYLLGKPRWSATLQHYSGYAPCDLQSCVHSLHQLFLRTRTSALPASREKYSSPRLGAVSAIGAPETLPDWLFH
jgi:cyclin-A